MKKLLYTFTFFILSAPVFGQVKIPIEYYRHIYLKGKLNGAPTSRFVFDTGAHDLYIDSCFYAESGLAFEKLGNAVLPGAGTGRQKAKVVMDKLSYAFHDNIYQPKLGVIFNLRPILGDFADGIIGKNYFDGQCLEINYKENYMKKYNAVSEINLTGYKKVQGRNVGGMITIPVTIKISNDLTITEHFLLDLGSGGTINLNSTTANKYAVDRKIGKKMHSYTSQGGVGGSSQSYTLLLPEVSVAGYTLKDMTASRSLDKSGALASTKYAGLIGNEIMDRFSLVIDFKDNSIYLKPNEDINLPFNKTTFGFFFANRFKDDGGYWQVNGFYKGLPAESSGMKAGDKIKEVNGVPVKNITTFEKQKEILDSNVLRLKIERKDSPLEVTITRETLDL